MELPLQCAPPPPQFCHFEEISFVYFPSCLEWRRWKNITLSHLLHIVQYILPFYLQICRQKIYLCTIKFLHRFDSKHSRDILSFGNKKENSTFLHWSETAFSWHMLSSGRHCIFAAIQKTSQIYFRRFTDFCIGASKIYCRYLSMNYLTLWLGTSME